MSEVKHMDIPFCSVCPDGEAWQLTRNSPSKRFFLMLCQEIHPGYEKSQAQAVSSADGNLCHLAEAKGRGGFA